MKIKNVIKDNLKKLFKNNKYQEISFEKMWFLNKSIDSYKFPKFVSKALLDIKENGFTIIKNNLTDEECDAVIKDFDEFTSSQIDSEKYRDDHGLHERLCNLHLVSKAARRICFNKNVSDIIHAAFLEKFILVGSLFFEKGSAQSIHRDTPAFFTNPLNHFLGIWNALEDIKPGSGPLIYYPKGHKILEDKDLYLNKDIKINNYFKKYKIGKNLFKLRNVSKPVSIRFIYTGANTMTGGRLKKLGKYFQDDNFMFTYGDGLGNINLKKLLTFHKKYKRVATVTAVRPLSRYGILDINGNKVRSFKEKQKLDYGWINGGFFIFNRKIFNCIKDSQTVLEKEPLDYLSKKSQLYAIKHKGFWYVLLNRWMFEYPNIKRSLVKDLLKNPRVMFFHRNYNKIHLISAVLSLLISFKFFIGFIVMPFVLSYIFYGLFNTLGHKNGKPVTNHIINLFAAGEGYHDTHHENWKKIRLGKYDLSGLIIEKVLR